MLDLKRPNEREGRIRAISRNNKDFRGGILKDNNNNKRIQQQYINGGGGKSFLEYAGMSSNCQDFRASP